MFEQNVARTVLIICVCVCVCEVIHQTAEESHQPSVQRKGLYCQHWGGKQNPLSRFYSLGVYYVYLNRMSLKMALLKSAHFTSAVLSGRNAPGLVAKKTIMIRLNTPGSCFRTWCHHQKSLLRSEVGQRSKTCLQSTTWLSPHVLSAWEPLAGSWGTPSPTCCRPAATELQMSCPVPLSHDNALHVWLCCNELLFTPNKVYGGTRT